jgi:hypothetical protein
VVDAVVKADGAGFGQEVVREDEDAEGDGAPEDQSNGARRVAAGVSGLGGEAGHTVAPAGASFSVGVLVLH